MRQIQVLSAALLSTGFTASAAFAGSAAEPVIEPAPVAPVPAPEYTGGQWTGGYAGAQLGYGDVSGDGALDGVDGDDTLYGIHLGYNYDYGAWVSGIELDYDEADIDIGGGAATVEDVTRLKLKAGYDMGRWLPYATAGAARVNTTAGDDTGPFYGVGVAWQATEQFTIGTELLRHNFSDLGNATGADADATTLTVRASFRF
ncbi:outer membrane beta-barrel protein [uncultured Roseobacter sp.]|uniref:outer membrane protein n=1 Tax=uncultured Roseobacter sp. TaxID=114847 RepID=UPI00260D0370|nr:outer membrane beta-barrel protein [uncultured Roseobacter sp.]